MCFQLTKRGIFRSHLGEIKTFRTSKNIEGLESFLGLVNYIGKWIPNLVTIIEPLRNLLRLKLGKQANIQQHWKDSSNYLSRIKKKLSLLLIIWDIIIQNIKHE